MITITNVPTLKMVFSYYSPTPLSIPYSNVKTLIDTEDWITDDAIKPKQRDLTQPYEFWLSPYLSHMDEIFSQHVWPINVTNPQNYLSNINNPIAPISVVDRTIKPTQGSNMDIIVAKPLDVKFSPHGYIEGGVLYGRLTAGYGIWFNQYLKTFVKLDKKNSINLELAHDYEFNQHGDYAVIQQAHVINDCWYTHVGIGVSNSSIFVPKYYIGGAIFRKLMNQGQLVPFMGAHAYWWRPNASTEDLNPGLIYYFSKPWVMELGAFINRSNPGTVYSASAYAVITEGREKEHFYTLRYGFGQEDYLPLGPNVPGVFGFRSMVVTATWRQWIGKNWGTNIVGENYNNPFYKRYGLSVGLFMDFSI